MIKTVKLSISGRVQGVGFRNFVKEKADRFGVKGYVRNLSNGDVEADIISVNELIDLCKIGPQLSRVESVKAEKIEKQNFTRFELR